MACMAVSAQLTLPFGWLPLDLTLLLTVFTGLVRGGGAGAMTGVFCGLVLDSLVSPAFGLYSLALGLAGSMADLLHQNFNLERFLGQAVTMGALSLVHDLAMWQAAAWLGLQQEGMAVFLSFYAIPKMAVHALLAVPAFFVLRRLVRPRGNGRFGRVPKMIRTLPNSRV
jgi:rod shape-determining protein MreD